MAKPVMYKCLFCGKEVGSEVAIKFNNIRYVCSEDCKTKESNKLKYKPQPIKSDGTVNDRRILSDYIQYLYREQSYKDHQINWVLIMSVLKNMMDEHKDYTYKSIRYVLWYMKKIKQMDLFSAESNTVLALVPFNYNEAKQFALECNKIRDSVSKFEMNDEVIVIKKKEKVVKDYIDINDL